MMMIVVGCRFLIDAGIHTRTCGSVLGPLLFTAFISPIARVADRHNIPQRQYADDIQVYMKFTNASVAAQVDTMQHA